MNDKPMTHQRPVRKANNRLSKTAGAKETIKGFDHNMDIIGLTFGQFSLLDLMEATLEITGSADVIVSTWSAGFYDVNAAQQFRDNGKLRSIRFLMDSSAKRGQATVGDVGDIFGNNNVRATRLHAKFAVITNNQWSVVITTSMNLNLNPRCEHFEMTDDNDRAQLFLDFTNTIFNELTEGDTGDRKFPRLENMTEVIPDLGIDINRSIQMGAFTQ